MVTGVACGGGEADIHGVAVRVNEATRGVESYKFEGELGVTVRVEGGDVGSSVSEGHAELEGEFVSPNKAHIWFTSGALPLDGQGGEMPPEVLFDGSRLFFRTPGSQAWQGESSSRAISILQGYPTLGEITSWLFLLTDVVQEDGGMIDGVETLHIQGSLVPQVVDRAIGARRTGEVGVWIGRDDNLVRTARYEIRDEFVMALSELGGSPRPTQVWEREAELWFSGYGEPVNIVAP